MKKIITLLLSLFLLVSCLSACNMDSTDPTQTETTATTAPTEETAAASEPRMPLITDNNIDLYYDDYFDLSQLGDEKATVEIKEQTVASKKVGSDDADDAVIYYHEEKNCLIAVGLGTATITVNGTEYMIHVHTAPISLFMITGHSIGEGKTGVAEQSVLCAEGTAYSMHGAKNVESYVPGTGIGFSAAQKPKDINAFTVEGQGVQGEAGALAWKWNQLTGEKVWVLNAAVGGTCLSEWAKGQPVYENAVNLFKYAQKVLRAEIAAGHYRLKDMAIIYHSATNFAYKNVEYTDDLGERWYDSMWNGFKTDLSMDMDGDGVEETVQKLGFVPIWIGYDMAYDKPANYLMAASDAYSDVFMASLAGKGWLADSDFKKNFPEIDYEIHEGSISVPSASYRIFSDGVHYVQSAYNALGLSIGENMYRVFRTVEKPTSLTLVKSDGNKIYDKMDVKLGKSIGIMVYVEPYTVDDLTFTVSDNLEIKFPCRIIGKEVGEGNVTISYKDEVLASMTITVKE